MLLTRCPECRTTFRVTTEALEAADGHVRCGRCSTAFNAYTELTQATDPEAAAPPTGGDREDDDPLARTDEFEVPQQLLELAIETHVAADETGCGPRSFVQPAQIEAERIVEVVERIRRGKTLTADSRYAGTPPPMTATAVHTGPDSRPQEDDAIPPEQVEAVLAATPDAAHIQTPWIPESAPRRQPSKWWLPAACLASIALGAQLVHHNRGDLAVRPVIGTGLTGLYAKFGHELIPAWDIGQYQIMDWVASADANGTGPATLNITARILNRGPHAQPFPHVHLELKDRWDTPVGSRIFRPDEYLDSASSDVLMQPGQTARAQLEVIDPGQDAYGFQLDVCIATLHGALQCATDQIFR